MLAIKADKISKSYKIYPSPGAMLVEWLTFGRAVRHTPTRALTDLSFELQEGETLGLIGANGAGKSTLLRLMARITEPTTGSIEVHGRVSALMELAAGFHPDFTGRDNIAIKCALLGMSKEEEAEKFAKILEFSELVDVIDHPVRTYSTGMYVRLGFSVAIMVEPDIILIDEVLTVGDQHFQDKCLRRIRELKDGGTTIVIVSHDMKPVKYLCDRVLWLDQGRPVDFGPSAHVVDEYIDTVRVADSREAIQAENVRMRTGSREVWIEGVRILDAAGAECSTFASGDSMAIEIKYDTRIHVERPTFLVTLFRNDDVEVGSCSSRTDGVSPERIAGPGIAVLSIPRLDLLSGSYEVTAEIQDASGIRPYDAHYRLYSFKVRNAREDFGICRLEHAFRFEASP